MYGNIIGELKYIHKQASPTVKWECRYIARFDIAKLEFAMKKPTSLTTGEQINYGNFNNFKMELYHDKERTKNVVDNFGWTFYVGHSIYAAVSWDSPIDS